MKTKRIVSIILSVLMACSVFAGLSVAADDDANHTYTVVGDAAFLGASWTPNTPADDMALQADGTYKITYTGVAKSDLYTVKVAQDHAWDVSFGATLGEANPANIEFSVPEDNSTVDVILTLQGTRDKDGVTIPDGFVKVLVNGTDAPGKVVPPETAHYVAGEAGLCNGVAWNQADETNKMTKNEDGSYEITIKNVQPKEDGTAYKFKVTTNGAWEPAYGYDGLIVAGGADQELAVTKADSEVRIVLTADLKVKVYVNGEDVTPEPITTESTPAPTQTTNDKGETSAVTSHGGIYTGPTTGGASKRYFFAMPEDWYTFNNATACAYWWEGTDQCNALATEELGGWQHSYQMRATSLKLENGANVYYIDAPADVTTLIFNNGIDGGTKAAEGEQPSINWGKNFQTDNLKLEGYEAGDSASYPDGVTSFENMIYVVDPTQTKVNDYSGATTYGGEWYYLHADGKYDTTAGSTYEVKDVTAVITTKTVSIYPGKTAKINVKYSNTTAQTTKTWASSNKSVATVDQNGVVKGVKAGKATITLTVQNPGDAQALVLTKDVTVKQYVTSIKLNASTKAIYNGKSFTLKATVNPKNAAYKTVTFSSNNTRIATVNSKGVVVGKKPGTAYITVKAKDGSNKSARCKVIVKQQKATKLTISAKKTTTLKKKGASVKIKATLYPSNTYNKQIKVTSSKKGIVKLSASKINSGKTVTVKATKKGSTVVKFTAADGSRKSAQTKVTVKK
ncbi:Ig-like domain-containing protein [Ruminococcus bovis]|uniref:BIG2 domain-containing protein n=1 Tax=Ruminococcus bovis TaxID=2564099 RepID=A0A4P8XUV2_9FIRM|nr:Ig-like domain-containing protein [Ruminococcus bovis]QCT06687.1 hypothetical protein E5Z56_04595 [Ruminococcus bovis]